MKKLFLTLFALMMAIPSLWAQHDFEVDGIYYYINVFFNNNDDEVVVTFRGSNVDSYTNEYSGHVTIPSSVTYNGTCYSVTGIGHGAFKNCTDLTSVTIPESVIWIREDSFYGCTGLTSVSIPESVTWIRSSAFYNTPWYNNLPDGVIYMGKVLYDYKGTMPDNTSIEIKEGTVSITESAFKNCTGLTSVTIPNSVTMIRDEAFYGCTGLTEVTIGNGVTSIGSSAFYNCTGLTSVTIPNSVTSIGEDVFSGCSGLTEVTIPNSVTSIGEDVFSYCTGLTEVTIPNSVTEIGWNAFKGCDGLTSITIPNSVTEIGGCAFYNCTGLTSVTIGSGVTSIGYQAFYGSDGLKSIYVYNSIPPTADDYTFGWAISSEAILYVPTGSKSTYMTTSPWSNFWDIRELDALGVEDVLAESTTVTIQDGAIVVNGVENPVYIEVYNLQGQRVYSGYETTIPMNERGIYLVRIANRVVKVVL